MPIPISPANLVEVHSLAGQFVGQYSVDPNNGGAFGVNITTVGFATVRLAAVDDNANVLKTWTTLVQ